MKFVSTRKRSPPVSFSEAILMSLAPDGGLYVPERFAQFKSGAFEGANTLAEIGVKLLDPLFKGDRLQKHLKEICEASLTFPIPLVAVGKDTSVLELFHGPTSAFKDVGARFLAQCFKHLSGIAKETFTILVATSGDTGGAVASAFHGMPGVEVIILFPKGKISSRQEKQLTCWRDNVRAFAVKGDFDQCQAMVKEAFLDEWWKKNRRLISANSINIGRLAPQQIYYAAASLEYFRENKSPPNFIIPTGNLGNAVAALWAKKSGLPIGKVVLATNANRSLANYFETGNWAPEPTIATLANAMDVGNPSNSERLFDLYPTLADLKQEVSVVSVSDDEIRRQIEMGEKSYGKVWCPHTATALHARQRQATPHWIVVSTAHPSKFESIVEPLVRRVVEIPDSLAVLLKKKSFFTEIDPTLAALKAYL